MGQAAHSADAATLLTASVLAEVEVALEAAYPAEGCGVVVTTAEGATRVLVSDNLTDAMRQVDPGFYGRRAENGYVLDARLIVAAERRGERLRVIFHSHPDVGAYFSDEDARKALVDWGDGPEPAFPGVDYLVTAVNAGRAEESKLFRHDPDAGRFVEVARFAARR